MKYSIALAVLIAYTPIAHTKTKTIESIKSWVSKNTATVAGIAVCFVGSALFAAKRNSNHRYNTIGADPSAHNDDLLLSPLGKATQDSNKQAWQEQTVSAIQNDQTFHTPLGNRTVHQPPNAPKKKMPFVADRCFSFGDSGSISSDCSLKTPSSSGSLASSYAAQSDFPLQQFQLSPRIHLDDLNSPGSVLNEYRKTKWSSLVLRGKRRGSAPEFTPEQFHVNEKMLQNNQGE